MPFILLQTYKSVIIVNYELFFRALYRAVNNFIPVFRAKIFHTNARTGLAWLTEKGILSGFILNSLQVMGIQRRPRVRNQLVGFLIGYKTKGQSILVVKRTVNGWSEVTKKDIYFWSVVLQVNNYNPNIFRNAMNVARSRILGSSENQAILGKP